MSDVELSIAHLQRNSTSFDARFTLKTLKTLPQLHRQVTPQQLASLAQEYFSPEYVGKFISESTLPQPDAKLPTKHLETVPETFTFLHLLTLAHLFANASSSKHFEQVAKFAKFALDEINQQFNRRSLDHFVAKLWFYLELSAEKSGDLSLDLYPQMMSALRTSTLRNDFETQGMLITLLLRTLIKTNRIKLALDFVSKTSIAENKISNSLAARYYYYLARISAVELDYSNAFEQITAAIRKVPQTPSATGFLQTANKLSVLVELLTGDIPPLKAFGSKEQPELVLPLAPYLELAKAVRSGDVKRFEDVILNFKNEFKVDGNLSLAKRLRQNVIKTGIRVISLTYSKISLKDVCLKLRLESEESAEYIVAKAIRDGVIEAKINHQHGYMQSLDTSDVYSTKEPQIVFDERIQFSMALHDDNMKALRYFGADHQNELRDVQEALEREKELVTEIQENSDLEDDEGDFEF